jgi:HSP20 family molecular chaperone IbpA
MKKDFAFKLASLALLLALASSVVVRLNDVLDLYDQADRGQEQDRWMERDQDHSSDLAAHSAQEKNAFEASTTSPIPQLTSWPIDVYAKPPSSGVLQEYLYDLPNHTVVSINLPSGNIKELETHVENETLYITGVAVLAGNQPNAPSANIYFKKQIQLPEPVQGDKLKRHLSNGVLTVTVPKAKPFRPKREKKNAKPQIA